MQTAIMTNGSASVAGVWDTPSQALSAERETAIIRACQSGDWSGYGLLVQRYRRLAWAAVDAVLPGSPHAEDVVQEAFMRVYEKLHTFRYRSSFSSWLFSLARNQALMHRRTQSRRHQALSLEELAQSSRPSSDGSSSSSREPSLSLLESEGREYAKNPLGTLEQDSRQAALAGMLAELPQEQREALNLFYLGELSYEDIAQTLGLPLNTVRSRLHRAKERLQELASRRGWI